MGAFDDLIAQNTGMAPKGDRPSTTGAGAFDDLIEKHSASSPAPISSVKPKPVREAYEPGEEPSYLSNLGRGIGERGLDLAAGMNDTVLTLLEGAGVDPNAEFMKRGRRGGEAARNADLGYREGTSWEDFKDSPLTNFIPFALEQGIVSAPDMAGALLNLPAYIAARTGELGDQRAENNGIENATVGDLVKTLPAAAASAFLERLGVDKMLGLGEVATQALKQVPKAAGKAALAEGATEAGQELIEYTGTNAGTTKGFDPYEIGEQMAAAAVGGAGFGGVVRGASATGEVMAGRKKTGADDLIPEGATRAEDVLDDVVAPPADRERLYSTRLSDEDRASPIPNDLIDDGKILMDGGTPRAGLAQGADFDFGPSFDADVQDAATRQDMADRTFDDDIVAGAASAGDSELRSARAARAAQEEADLASIDMSEIEERIRGDIEEDSLQSADARPSFLDRMTAQEANAYASAPGVNRAIARRLGVKIDELDAKGDIERANKLRLKLGPILQSFGARPAAGLGARPVPPKATPAAAPSAPAAKAGPAVVPTRGRGLMPQGLDLDLGPDFDSAIQGAAAGAGDGSRRAPVAIIGPADLDGIAPRIAAPTESQAKAGNYAKGHARWKGLDLAIETPKGGKRTGTGRDGVAWEVTMPAHYGDFKGTKGADGDPVDVYVGDDPEADTVFIVDQKDAETGKFDEHKVFVGTRDEAEVAGIFENAFSDGRGGSRLQDINETTVEGLKDWLANGDKSKPYGARRPKARALPKRPVAAMLRAAGGVDPTSTLAGELRSMGITSKTSPGLFKRGGMGAADNFVREEYPLFEAGPDDGNGYIPEGEILEALRREMAGDPRRTADEAEGERAAQPQGREAPRGAKGRSRTITDPAAEVDRLIDVYGYPNSPELRQTARDLIEAGLDPEDAMVAAAERLMEQKAQPDAADTFNAAAGIPFFTGDAGWEAEADGEAVGAGRASPEGDGRRETGASGRADRDEPTGGGERSGAGSTGGAQPVEAGADGKPQLVIPGAEAIGQGELAQRKAGEKLKPKTSQKDMDVGMFGSGVDQADLLNMPAAKPKAVERAPATAAEKPADLSTDEAKAAKAATAPAAVDAKITDFGQKLEGARKDLVSEYRDSLDGEPDFETEPLSKVFPQPDYEKLAAAGADPRVMATIAVIRGEIPAKPRKGYKVRLWAESVQMMRQFARDLLGGRYTTEDVLQRMDTVRSLSGLRMTIDMITGLPPAMLPKAAAWRIRGASYTRLGDQTFSPAKSFYSILNGDGRTVYEDGSSVMSTDRDEIIEKARAIIEKTLGGEKIAGPTRKTPIQVYQDRRAKTLFIGFKGRTDVIRLKTGFESVKDARAYIADNAEELQAKIDAMRAGPQMRREVNRPREGADRREGDVSPEQFQEAFGFRGVQFGNYVEAGRRQFELNEAFDGLMDLAETLGLPPRAISLNGTLGLAFGARGRGGAAKAHYEPGHVAINLTKSKGAGSLAHEWFHGLDHYFAKQDASRDIPAFMSERKRANGATREEVFQAWKGVEAALKGGDFSARMADLDAARSKDYWNTMIEKAARAFERYVVDRIETSGGNNDYLANIDENAGAYPNAEEMKSGITAAFDRLFQTIETRETDQGVEMFSERPVDLRAAAAGWDEIDAASEPRLTEAEQEAVVEIVRRVSGLTDVEFHEAIRIPSTAKGFKAWGREGKDGEFIPIAGFYHSMQDIIAVALNSGGDGRRLAFHESFHRLQAMFLTDQEKALLAAETKALRAVVAAAEGREDQATRMSQSELEAEAFAIYSDRMERNEAAPLQIKGRIRAAWDRLRAMSRRVRNYLNGRGYQTFEDVFDMARSGEMKARGDSSTEKGVEPTFSVAPTGNAFKRWFGQSKIVDSKGRPLRVFHGTRSDVEAFRIENPNGSVGAYFSTSPRIASNYSLGKPGSSDGAQTIPVFLRVENPFVIKGPGFIEKAKAKLTGSRLDLRGEESSYITPAQMADMQAQGYDGIVHEGVDEIIVFSAGQVKSASGNNGTFDPNDDRIQFDIAPDFTGADAEPQKRTAGFLGKGQPIDRALAATFGLLPGVNITKDRKFKGGERAYNAFAKAISTAKFAPDGRMAWANNLMETARAGLIDRHGLDPAYVERDRARALDERSVMFQGVEVLKSLASQNVSVEEAKVLQAILTGESVNDADMMKLAEPIRIAIDELGQEAVQLGLLSAESYERNRGAYLHRVYLKHEADQNGLQKMVGKIMGNSRQKILGDQFKGRGMFLEVTQEAATKNLAEVVKQRREEKKAAEVSARVEKLANRRKVVEAQLAESQSESAVNLARRMDIADAAREQKGGARSYQKGQMREQGVALSRLRKKAERARTLLARLDAEINAGKAQIAAVQANKAIAGKFMPIKGETYTILDKKAVVDGKERTVSRVYVPTKQSIPSKYADYVSQGIWEVRGEKGGKVVMWRDYSKDERGKMGEILDARYTIGKTYLMMAHDLSTGRFYKDIAANPEWVSKEEPEGASWKNAADVKRLLIDPELQWVKVPDAVIPKSGGKKRWGALSGQFVRAEIWRDMTETEIMQQPTVWRMLLSQWKLNKTARSPVTHMNNVMSNLMFMDLADVRFSDLASGIRAYAKGTADYDEAVKYGAFGVDMMAQEIRKNFLQPILDELTKTEQGGVENSFLARAGILGKLADTIWTTAKAADAKMLDAYRVEDEVFRMATYMRRREMGDSAEQAALVARETFMDYDIRAPWVNAARNTVLPFASYTYRAVPMIAKMLATRPWKLAKYMTIAYALNALAYAWDDDGDEEKERASLRDEEQGKTWLGVPRMMRMPFRNDDGLPVFLDVRRWLPAGDVFDTNQGSSAIPVPSPLQFGGPLLLAFEVFAFNKSTFTGEEIVNPETDTLGDKAAKVGDYLWKAWLPSAAWIPGSWYWDKIANAAAGATDGQGRPYDLPSALSSSIGIKLKPQDVESGLQWQFKDLQKVQTELKAEARRLGRQRERGLISQSAYERGMATYMQKLERLGLQAQELQQKASGG